VRGSSLHRPLAPSRLRVGVSLERGGSDASPELYGDHDGHGPIFPSAAVRGVLRGAMWQMPATKPSRGGTRFGARVESADQRRVDLVHEPRDGHRLRLVHGVLEDIVARPGPSHRPPAAVVLDSLSSEHDGPSGLRRHEHPSCRTTRAVMRSGAPVSYTGVGVTSTPAAVSQDTRTCSRGRLRLSCVTSAAVDVTDRPSRVTPAVVLVDRRTCHA
jgi:hypothetical protein